MWKKQSKNGIIVQMLKKIEISHKTIIFTVLFLLGLWLLFYLRTIILQLFVAFLLMTMMKPLVNLLSKIKIPRTLSVIITYVLVIGILGGMIALIAPTLVQQTTNFINALPSYLSNINVDVDSLGLLNQFGDISGKVLNFTVSVFSNIFSLVTILVFTFYLLLTHNGSHNQIKSSLGEERGNKVSNLISEIEEKLGKWAGGQLILMLAVGVGIYLGLLLIKIPFALPLAILASIFEIVPVLGPIAAAIPAVLIGFGISPLTGVGAIVVAFLVNQLENYVLVPKIMQKSAGVSPIVVLIAITIGAKLLGVMGVIVAVPVVITLQVLLKNYLVKEE